MSTTTGTTDAASAAAEAAALEPPAAKQARVEATAAGDGRSSADTPQQQQEQLPLLHNFDAFRLHEVLDSSAKAKFVALLGRFDDANDEEGDDSNNAVLLLEKEAFPVDQLSSATSLVDCLFDGHRPPAASVVMHNDVWHKYRLQLAQEHCSAKATLIHPATARLVAKYRRRPVHLVVETPEDYRQLTEPALAAADARHSLAWVRNVLDGSAERDRLVHADSHPDVGYALHADLKWDGRRLDDLYCLAVCRRQEVYSLRQLGEEHLPLLCNLLNGGRAAISAKYGVPISQLRVFLHYQPSFYHLHAHFTHVAADWPGQQAERAHLLSTVIANIRLMPDYYQRVALSFPVKEGDPLFDVYKDRLSGG